MKNKDLMWIGLALAAGYLIAQQKQPVVMSQPRTIASKNQKPEIFTTKPEYNFPVFSNRRFPSAIAGHHCACRRRVPVRYSVV